MTRTVLLVMLTIVCLAAHRAGGGEAVRLAADGKALRTIGVAKDASDSVRKSAQTLADTLTKISGASFLVETADGTPGIVVGTASDFPALVPKGTFDPDPLRGREQYLLHSHGEEVRLIGSTELAVEHAVWDFLNRLGYRHYFPGEHWEVIPRQRELTIDVDTIERPDYLARRIWYGYGTWDYNAEPYRTWCARNRCVAGIQLNTGHAYDEVVRESRQQFEKHSDYWPLLQGKRQPVGNTKPCLAKQEVRDLFVQSALRKFAKAPSLDSVSIDPSDGGGWCQCEQCAKLGSVSDQAITLANEVAAAINREHPGKLLGIYAYNYHSPPPSVTVDPHVVVSVATAFIKEGLKVEDLLAGWSKQGATLGIREYYSVNTWDRDLPARSRGGNLAYLRRTIPEFHARGARFLSAESSDNWGPNGLGYYLAARMLWDVDEAKNIDALTDDFLSRCFGPAEQPMREFYRQLDGSHAHLVFDDQVGRMFRSLDEARRLIGEEADNEQRQQIEARLNDLVLYTRYVDLFHRYSITEGAERQAAFEAMLRHAYRMRRSMMVHVKAIYRDVVARDKNVSIPAGSTWNVAEADNPWKSSEPFARTEFGEFVREGIERYSLVDLDFEPVEFSNDLVSADPLKLEEVVAGSAPRGRGKRTYYALVERGRAAIELQITGGLIKHYRDRGNVRVELHKLGGASESGQREQLIATDQSVPPDGVKRTVSLPVKEAGLYRIDLSDGGDLTSVDWAKGQRISFHSSLDAPISTHGRWSLYFYVPRGTKVIGLYGNGEATIQNPAGETVFSLDQRTPGYHSIPVEPGTDGKLWKVHHASAEIRLLTVPPYLARSPGELLLPREVIEQDNPSPAE